MGIVATGRFIIVCTAAAKATVNQTLALADPTSVGDPITSALTLPSSPTGPIVGWWGSWATDATTLSAIRSAVQNANWSPKPTPAEKRIYQVGDNVPAWPTQRVWIFETSVDQKSRWTPTMVLNELGLSVEMPVDIF